MLDIGQKITLITNSRSSKKINVKVIYKNKFYFTVEDINTKEKDSFQWNDIKTKAIQIIEE